MPLTWYPGLGSAADQPGRIELDDKRMQDKPSRNTCIVRAETGNVATGVFSLRFSSWCSIEDETQICIYDIMVSWLQIPI
jgi:hypothetical protein